MNVYVRELGRALAARGVTIDIFTRRQSTQVEDVVEYAPGARVIHIDAGPHRHVDKYDVIDYLPDFACGVQRFRALTGASYDVIHSHYWLSGRLGLLFAEHWGVPLVSMFHTLAQLKNRVAETAAEREQAVTLRNRATHDGRLGSGRRAYRDRPPTDATPLQDVDADHGDTGAVWTSSVSGPTPRLEARAALGLSPSERIILFVGRIQRLKGLEVLVRAFAQLADLNARLLIVGGQAGTSPESREISRLQHLAARLGIAERTNLSGPCRTSSCRYFIRRPTSRSCRRAMNRSGWWRSSRWRVARRWLRRAWAV